MKKENPQTALLNHLRDWVLFLLSEKDFRNMIEQQKALSEIKHEAQSAKVKRFRAAKSVFHKGKPKLSFCNLKIPLS